MGVDERPAKVGEETPRADGDETPRADGEDRRPTTEREATLGALLEPPRLPPAGFPVRLRSNRPFIWFVGSLVISHIAFYAFFIGVMGEATYRYGARAFHLGVLFSSFSVVFLLTTTAFGTLADRWSPKWQLLIAQVAWVAAPAVALASRSIWWLYMASVLDGLGAAAAIPARGAMTGLLVEERDLVRANALTNTASMVGAIAGPAAGGFIVRVLGQDPEYWFIMAVVLMGAVPLLAVTDRRPSRTDRTTVADDLIKGFRASWQRHDLRRLLFLTASIWFFLSVWAALLSLFVKQHLGRGPDEFNFLWAVHGIGALAGAAVVTVWKRATGNEVRLIGLSLVVAGAGFLGLSSIRGVPFAVAGSVVLGVGLAWYLSLSQALVQRVAGEEMRGRITGVVGMLGETCGLVATVSIAVVGRFVGVRALFVVSAVLLTLSGFPGLLERGDPSHRPDV